MNLNKKYKIEGETLNIVISEKYVGKKGKHEGEDLWKEISYHSNLEQALDFIIDKEIRGTGVKDLETVVNKIEELKTDIKSMLKEIV